MSDQLTAGAWAFAPGRSWRRRGRGSFITISVVAALLVGSVAAVADTVVVNDVVIGPGSTKGFVVSKGDLAGTPIDVTINGTGGDGGPTGPGGNCNATATSPISVSLTGLPTGVAASPSSVSFTNCSDTKSIVVTAGGTSAAGDTTVSATPSGGTGQTGGASFTLRVAGSTADTTAPLINCTVPDQTIWYGSEVTVPCTAIDTGAGLADPSDASFSLTTSVGAGAESATAQTDSLQVCDLASPSNCATAGPYSFMVDRKAPTNVSGGPDRAPDHGGWYNAPVGVGFTGSDGGSGIASCTSATYDGPDGTGVTVDGSCVDSVGNASDDVASSAFDYDATVPDVAVTGVTDGVTYVLGGVPAAGCSTNDATSGVATSATIATVGGPVGSIVATCSGASDNAGNAAADVSVTYRVVYDWRGFFQPVDNIGWNVAKAGQSIPVKFSLGGDQGLDVLKANFPKATPIQCPGSSSTPDPIEEYVTGTANDGLVYDALAGQYVYVWKTPKASAGKCFEFQLGLKDDTTRTFRVQFTR